MSVQVGTATRALELGQVQAQGKKPMAAADWARGISFDGKPALGLARSEVGRPRPGTPSSDRARRAAFDALRGSTPRARTPT